MAANTTGPLSATATAATATFDPNAGNDSAATSTAVVASADLAISKDDGVTEAVPGGSVTYAIVVSNAGPSDAPGTTVTDSFPAACTSVTWTCSGTGGASCTADGSGNIVDVVSVPAAGSVSYSAVCSIDPAATGSLVNTASVAAAAGVTDPTQANNSATDIDRFDALFEDGFEDPAVNAPSGSYRLPSLALRSALDEVAHAVLVLDDAQGEALRVYARLRDGQVQYALAPRDGIGLGVIVAAVTLLMARLR